MLKKYWLVGSEKKRKTSRNVEKSFLNVEKTIRNRNLSLVISHETLENVLLTGTEVCPVSRKSHY